MGLCVSTAVHGSCLLTWQTYWPSQHACFSSILETALTHWNILIHDSPHRTCSFKKPQDITVVCYLGTADSLVTRMCCKDCCHMQHSASKCSSLFVLAWSSAHSWLIMLFAQEKLKMSFRNSFVRTDSPSPSPFPTSFGEQGERRRKKAFNKVWEQRNMGTYKSN